MIKWLRTFTDELWREFDEAEAMAVRKRGGGGGGGGRGVKPSVLLTVAMVLCCALPLDARMLSLSPAHVLATELCANVPVLASNNALCSAAALAPTSDICALWQSPVAYGIFECYEADTTIERFDTLALGLSTASRASTDAPMGLLTKRAIQQLSLAHFVRIVGGSDAGAEEQLRVWQLEALPVFYLARTVWLERVSLLFLSLIHI